MAYSVQRDDARPIPIADVYGPAAMSVPAAESEANARLIAAAPEMYEALAEARRFVALSCVDADPEVQDEAKNTLPVIDAALAKARGEQ